MSVALCDAMARAVAAFNDAGWIVSNDVEEGRVSTRLTASPHRPPHAPRRTSVATTDHVARNLADLMLGEESLALRERARVAYRLVDALCDADGTSRRELPAEAILARLEGFGIRVKITPTLGVWHGCALRRGAMTLDAWSETPEGALASLCIQVSVDSLAWAALRLVLRDDFAATLPAPHMEGT